ncbi:hypothetical protein [Helicobacter sp. T3_23-1059]
MNDKITHFTQSTFELESFKAILVEIFPQIHFIEPNKRTLPHSILKSQTAICKNFKLSNKNFDIYIFECESIRAKVGIHTELKSILKHAGLDAILAIFHTPHSTSLVKEPHPKSLPQGEGLAFDSPFIANADFAKSSPSLARGDFQKSTSLAERNFTLSPSLAEGDTGGGLSLQTSKASVANQVAPSLRDLPSASRGNPQKQSCHTTTPFCHSEGATATEESKISHSHIKHRDISGLALNMTKTNHTKDTK